MSRDQGLSSTGHSQLQLDPTPLAQLSSSDNLVTPLGKKIVERLKMPDREKEGRKTVRSSSGSTGVREGEG